MNIDQVTLHNDADVIEVQVENNSMQNVFIQHNYLPIIQAILSTVGGCRIHFKDVFGYLLHLEIHILFNSICRSYLFFPFQIKLQSENVPRGTCFSSSLKDEHISVPSWKAGFPTLAAHENHPGAFENSYSQAVP